jgi:apolipoprotein N-acyltransferase
VLNIKIPYVKSLFALLTGIALPFAFAPCGFYPLAIICPALLLGLWLTCSPKQAFWHGLLFGIGFFGVGVSWIYISIHQYGNTNIPLAVFITALFIFILALFPALEGYLLNRFLPNKHYSKSCIAFPSLWVLLEWVRSWFFTGFPWLFLGASQTNSPLSGFAPFIGEYGLTFSVTFLAGLCVFAATANNRKKIIYVGIVIITIFSLGQACTHIAWTQSTGKPIQISLVQGNISQQIKWNRDYLNSTLERYYSLTKAHWDSRIIIWPEAAIPLLQKDAQPFLDKLNQEAQQHHATLITGLPIQNGFSYYNGMLALGNDQAVYYKRHLVPFGEYVPFENLLRGLIGFFDIPMSNFSAGAFQQATFQVNGLNIGAFICYEVVYPEIILSALPQAQILLTLSDDAWFGHSFASAQHLQIGQFMAQATRRYLIFSTNDGITAIVTPHGKIQQQIPRFQADVLTGTVMAMEGKTPWIIMGDTPWIILMFVLFGMASYVNNTYKR